MRVLIVDDEPLARDQLLRLCEAHADVSIVGQVDSGAAAIEALGAENPDLVLLDIELNDMSGFEVLRACEARGGTHAIMVTAHREYALDAFSTSAIDYLTKPVVSKRFADALARARQRIARSRTDTLLNELSSRLQSAATEGGRGTDVPRHLVGERGETMCFIEVEKVDYIEADGNYVLLHSEEGRLSSRNTLKRLEVLLKPAGFVRINKSLLINLGRVEFAQRVGDGTFTFSMQGGARLVSGVGYRRMILAQIRLNQLTTPDAPH